MSTLLTPAVAAERARLKPSTLARLRVTGGGPPFQRYGRRVLYPSDLLDNWIEARKSPVLLSTSEERPRSTGSVVDLPVAS